MRPLVPILVGALSTASACSGPGAGSSLPENAGPATPVLIELFTSEGCSSCPPADQLLRTLVSTQPIRGVEVVALGEHVDYWNSLGWPDRFSSPAFTQRQSEYHASVFPSSAVYTPQLVIDGALERIGSDEQAVRQAIQRAAQSPKADVRVITSRPSARTQPITVEIHIPPSVPRDGPADVVVAAIEDGLVTPVVRGENRGRTLAHGAVVRLMQIVGAVEADQQTLSLSWTVPIRGEWRREHMRIVAFVQERVGRRVLGVASADSVPDHE